MKCPGCQTDNSEEAKFCGKCGKKLFLICPQCGSENTPGNNFCNECGHTLTLPSETSPKDLSFDEKIDKIQRYLPEGLTEKILSQRDKIVGEHKQVTVMFCDMKNFTPLVEKLGPEDAYHIMDQVYEILITTVHYYGGIVNEMTGDGILALFGAPTAMEDAPQRAIRTSIKIHKEIVQLNHRIKAEGKTVPTVQMRIGINSGSVVVGSLGNELKSEFKVVGDTVNVASRLEGIAEPGTTYISEDTFKLAKGLFRFEALGEKQIKGKNGPVKVYRLISSSNSRTRFDVSAEHGLTPLVGRERELELLVDGFNRIRSNNGQVITVVSEAGIGKSRLVYEFRKTITNEDVMFLEGRCLSYSKGISYHLIIDLLKSKFNIHDDDPNIKEKILTSLNDMGINEKETAPYIFEILSLKNSGINTRLMSPDAMKDKLAHVLKLIIQKLSEMRPLVWIIEDLHWADQNSVDVINLLFEIIPGARILAVFTFRPEFSPNWGTWSYHSQVTLYKLTTNQIVTMLNHILGPSRSNSEFIDFIVARTEGTPFFIEEFVKYLTEQNLVEKKENSCVLSSNIHELQVPSTIQDIIMARTDRISEKAKEILRIGSVVEREFGHSLIRLLVEYPESELLSILSELKKSELIFERNAYPGSVYVFKHALIMEIIYKSILSGKKKQYHEKIGFALEQLYQRTPGEHYEILARHFILGENFEKGAEYSRLSCKKMLKTASPHNAIHHAVKRIDCLEKLQNNNDIETQLIGARVLLGLLYTQKNYHVPAMEAIQPIIALAEKRNEKRLLSQIYTISGAYQYIVEEDFPGAFGRLRKAITLSEDANDAISNIQASYWLGLGQAIHCNFNEAECNLNKVLEANKAVNILWGISSLKSVISYFVYYYRGMIEKGFLYSLDAIKVAEENKDIATKAMAFIAHGVMLYCRGQLDVAAEHLTRGVELCEKCRFFSWNGMGQMCLGEMNYEIGKYEQSSMNFNRLVALVEKGEISPSWRSIGKIGFLRAEVAGGYHRIDPELLERHASEVRIACFEGVKSRFLSEIFFNMGSKYENRAEPLMQTAIHADKTNCMDFSLGKDYQTYARQLDRKGNFIQAKIYYEKSIDVFKKCMADGWIEISTEELEKMETSGNGREMITVTRTGTASDK